ncbi:hypothetical protein IJR75_03025 [bacterium]|nr:hypothetical protein [bacterium]
MVGLTIIFFLFPIKKEESTLIFYYLLQNLFIFFATVATIISGLIYTIEITKCTKRKNEKN